MPPEAGMLGGIGATVLLLLYSFLTSFILLFGAACHAAVEHLDPAGENRGDKSAG